MLASWDGVLDAVVGMGHGAEDEIDLVHELRAAERKVLVGAGIEYDEATVGVGRAGGVVGHGRKLRAVPDVSTDGRLPSLSGRGLLVSPNEIARRTIQITTWGQGFNAAEATTHIRSRADALAGLMALGVGFLLQGGGYVALVAGVKIETGLDRAVVSVGLALVAAGAAFQLFRRVRWRLVKRFTVQVARANPATGQLDELPDQETLIALCTSARHGCCGSHVRGSDRCLRMGEAGIWYRGRLPPVASHHAGATPTLTRSLGSRP